MEVSALQPRVSAADIAPERLAGNPSLTEKQKIAEASRQFEAILLRQILGEAQKTVFKSEFSDDSTASGIYQDMITTTLADDISKSGAFGLAKTFERQLDRPADVAAKTDDNTKTSLSTAHHRATFGPAEVRDAKGINTVAPGDRPVRFHE